MRSLAAVIYLTYGSLIVPANLYCVFSFNAYWTSEYRWNQVLGPYSLFGLILLGAVLATHLPRPAALFEHHRRTAIVLSLLAVMNIVVVAFAWFAAAVAIRE